MRWEDPTTPRAVDITERLDRSWFRTRLRARIPDGARLEQKELRTARGMRLFWFLQRAKEAVVEGPYVCPGCYAVGGEPCAPGCIDAEIEQDRLDQREGWDDEETQP